METRSRKSKSRSTTPFSVEQFSQEFLDKETLAENTVRITRSTTSYKIKESQSRAVDEVTSTIKTAASSGSYEYQGNIHKTSDYSSEDGENEVSSTRALSNNERNQMIEDARAAANGGGKVSAFELYKKAGRYWEVYPKTDYTYSPISKDRVELAPGVVAMPNMSRRTIHSVHRPSGTSTPIEFLHKETNTDSYRPRQLFGYRNEASGVSTSGWRSVRSTVVATFTRIVVLVSAVWWFVVRPYNAVMGMLYKFAGNVMLFDTWLLARNRPVNKVPMLVGFSVVSLLAVGGACLLCSLLDSSENQSIPVDKQIPKEPFAYQAGNDIITNQQKTIEYLKDEITNLRDEITKAQQQWQGDFNRIQSTINSPFIYRVNRCCKNPLIDTEHYVNKLTSKLLNDPAFLHNQPGLTSYLRAIFVARDELEARLSNITTKYTDLLHHNTANLMEEITNRMKPHQIDYSEVPDDRIKSIVKRALSLYDADKTGLVDYAVESMGGEILSTRCTEHFNYGKAVVSVLGIPLWYPVNSPRTLITPGVGPGQCWAFQNFPGFAMIRLSKRIRVEAFSVEHISRLLVPDGNVDSAPKEFEVFGLRDEYDGEPELLGRYEYDAEGEPVQFFDADEPHKVYEIVELRIVSNHGNPNYTCLYRFRVHGKSV
ncbi:unnamed protein product [Phyllotreta striolata]|uniref:SUN domain-containing protein n=1 Tax=Phyllotreta striolata TaxID=444603 RepID=A0A9N9XU07_PHYSR|nr:unnamed protein product [Phyllotreta striolata]